MMIRIRIIIALIMALILYSVAEAYHANLSFGSSIEETTIPPEGYPGLKFEVDYGPFKFKNCDFGYDCPPPPPAFGIIVEKQKIGSPGQGNCYVPVFAGLAGTTDCDGFERIYWGEGDITNLDWTLSSCCWPPLSCGVNRFIVRIGPLVSGTYRVRLLSYDWYEWYPGMGCEGPTSFIGWGHGRWVEDTQWGLGVVTNTMMDYISFTQLYYIKNDPASPDSVFDGGALEVLTDYNVVLRIRTTKTPGALPQSFVGYLYPEGVSHETGVNFLRWPEGDPDEPCDMDYILRDYTYISTQAYRPLDLFVNVPPEDWNSITRLMDCKLFGAENQVRNDIDNAVTVMSLLHLDRENDSTACFIPAKPDTMRFGFMFDRKALGLDVASDVRFQVKDKDNNLVFELPVRIADIYTDPNEFGIPDLPQMDSIRISWDGRMNRGTGDGHLANPHNDPYAAQVHIMENDQPVISSNMEGFNAVPWIDSVLVTHTPWYPPSDYWGFIDIYAIARAKIDDSENPSANFMFFVPPGQTAPNDLGYWDAELYLFHDLLPNISPKQFYEDLHMSIQTSMWQQDKWGILDYKWYHVGGYGYKSPNDNSVVDYTETDTTQWWGSEWRTEIRNRVEYRAYYGHPYMTLQVKSTISNSINGHNVEQVSSDERAPAHKIMMSISGERYPHRDIIFWAYSQIGVPYFYGGKDPYRKIDCSGFVTAARIQEIGVANNDNLRLSWINVKAYVNGYYYYSGDSISLGTEHVSAYTANRGDLVAIRANNSPNDWSKAHIGILDHIFADFETDYIYQASIIHACGKTPPFLRRVRYDNLLEAYRPETNGQTPWGGRFIYQFLRFTSGN